MRPCGAHGSNVGSFSCAACLELDARVNRLEGILRAAGIHEPGCTFEPARHENRGFHVVDFIPAKPCTCWLSKEST